MIDDNVQIPHLCPYFYKSTTSITLKEPRVVKSVRAHLSSLFGFYSLQLSPLSSARLSRCIPDKLTECLLSSTKWWTGRVSNYLVEMREPLAVKGKSFCHQVVKKTSCSCCEPSARPSSLLPLRNAIAPPHRIVDKPVIYILRYTEPFHRVNTYSLIPFRRIQWWALKKDNSIAFLYIVCAKSVVNNVYYVWHPNYILTSHRVVC